MSLYEKHHSMIVHTEEPFNAGPPLDLLGLSQVTPTPLFYARNHGPVPEVDPATYRLRIDGMVENPLSLSLADLRHFQPRTVIATLECAGNRRKDLNNIAPIPNEVLWDTEAIGTAEWTGIPLREVLKPARVQSGARHVAFTGMDFSEKAGETFGGSIPYPRALQNDVLLVYEMNGEPLPPIHGYPLRVVVPGYIGARSVKWLDRISLQVQPSSNYYQQHAYKLFPPYVDAKSVNWSKGLMLGELSVNAVITNPLDGESLPAGIVVVKGFALSGGGRAIDRVDVSSDGGKTWHAAELLSQPGNRELPWAWHFWRTRVTLSPGTHQLVARAWDTAANSQPQDPATIWNFKGYINNAWHRVSVTVADEKR